MLLKVQLAMSRSCPGDLCFSLFWINGCKLGENVLALRGWKESSRHLWFLWAVIFNLYAPPSPDKWGWKQGNLTAHFWFYVFVVLRNLGEAKHRFIFTKIAKQFLLSEFLYPHLEICFLFLLFCCTVNRCNHSLTYCNVRLSYNRNSYNIQSSVEYLSELAVQWMLLLTRWALAEVLHRYWYW